MYSLDLLNHSACDLIKAYARHAGNSHAFIALMLANASVNKLSVGDLLCDLHLASASCLDEAKTYRKALDTNHGLASVAACMFSFTTIAGNRCCNT